MRERVHDLQSDHPADGEARPGAVILFQFIYCWNDFIGPLIYINNQVWYPLSLGLNLILGTYTTNWPWVMAAATAATAPIIILFFFTQRTFIKGISIQGTGIKG